LDYDEYDENEYLRTPGEEKIAMTFGTSYDESPRESPPRPSTANGVPTPTRYDPTVPQWSSASPIEKQKTPLREVSPPVPKAESPRIQHNVWADDGDEEFGQEKEMSMTFE